VRQIVHGVGEFRNKTGNAHGKGPFDPIADTLQAELAITVAGAMAIYLLGVWEAVPHRVRTIGLGSGE
jgi:hypothetical protein